jgi:hypothetical protein
MNEGRINSTPDDEIYTPAYAVKVLLPISTLGGVYRSTLFQKYNLEVLVLDKRINFQGQRKGNWQNTSYFCTSILPKQLVFHTLDKEGKG